MEKQAFLLIPWKKVFRDTKKAKNGVDKCMLFVYT